MKRGRVLSLTLVLVTLVLGAIFFITNYNYSNFTGNVVANPSTIYSSNDYVVKEIATLPIYPWYMDSINGKVYVGTYGGSNNYYYVSQSPFTIWDPVLITNTGEESLRVYNLNNRLYITGEDGFISADLQSCANLKDKYVLGAEYFAGNYLVSIGDKMDDSRQTIIWNCPCNNGITCAKWKTLSGIRNFDMKEYRGSLYVIGTRDFRSGSGKVYRLDQAGNPTDTGWNYGEGVMAERFDDKIFFGYSGYTGSKTASVYSFDGTNIRAELSTPGMKHFGDFKEFDNKLFITVAQEPGGVEIWYREKNSNGGAWKKLTLLAATKYGSGADRVLINPTGMMAVADNRLFISVNSPYTVRKGPGYILEISKACLPSEVCGNLVDENCNEIIDDGCVKSDGSCSLFWSGKNFVSQNNSGGMSYYNSLDWITDSRFVCLNSRFYECGWELNKPAFAIKAADNQQIGDWTCNLNSKVWTNPNLIIENESGQISPGDPVILSYTYLERQPASNYSNSTISNLSNNVNYVDSDFDSVEESLDQCPGTAFAQPTNLVGCPTISHFGELNLSQDLSNSNLRNIEGLEISSQKGKIKFKQNVSLLKGNDSVNLGASVMILDKFIFVDSTGNPGLNSSAELEFYNVSFESPVILIDGVTCTSCQTLNYDQQTKTLRINVPHFTTYLVVNASDLIFEDNLTSNETSIDSPENLSEQYNPDPLENPPASNTPVSKPIWIYVVLIILFLAVLVLIAWFYYKKSPSEKPEAVQQTPQNIPPQGYTPFRNVRRRV
ncbi:hypothetical protein KA107_02560 [Candidatus Pacearchaeota archaeon]|nr:hypothetical protein [Candidatus Pacearchaeota archaeon]